MCHQTDHRHPLISDCSSPLTALRCWTQPLHPRPHGHAVTSHHGTTPGRLGPLPHDLLLASAPLSRFVSARLPQNCSEPQTANSNTPRPPGRPPSGLFGPAAAPRSLRPAWIPGHWRLFLLRSILVLCSLPPYSLEPVLILPSPCQHPAPAGPRGLSVSAACQHPEATGARPCPSPRPLGR